MTKPEKLYTLEEARQKLAEEECARWGHSIAVIYHVSSSDPQAVHCDRCGKEWKCQDH